MPVVFTLADYMDSEDPLSSTLCGATIQTAEGNDFSSTGRDTIKININIDRRSGIPDSEQASRGNTVEDNEDPQPDFGSKSGIYSAISTTLAAIFGRIAIQPVVGEPTCDSNPLLRHAVTDRVPDHDSEPAVTVCDITARDILSSSSMPNISTERYTRSILDCQCTAGYPLYEPRPDSGRSIEYWKKGVRIGDVGIVTKDGIFDFLFNVCPSQNPSINPLVLPDDFEAIECSETRVMEQHFKMQTHLFNNTVSRIEEPGVRYKCLGPEGAILELPAGATLFEAKNSASFKNLASRHAEKWYRYTNVTRGRVASNGSLYLVTSCIKCTHWGIAVFDRPSASQDYLQFVENEVLTTTNRNLSSKYDWKGSGAFIAKIPMDSDIPDSGDDDNSNQCVFLRGYKIMLRKDVWDNAIDPHSAATSCMPTSSSSSSNSKSKQTRGGVSDKQNEHLRREDGGGSESDDRISRWPAQNISEHGIGPLDVDTLLTTSSQIGAERVIIEADFNVSPLHPSDLINAVLLSQEPNAKVALTHDDDWWNLLQDYKNLTKLASSYRSVIDEYDIQPKLAPSTSPTDRSGSDPSSVITPILSRLPPITLGCSQTVTVEASAERSDPDVIPFSATEFHYIPLYHLWLAIGHSSIPSDESAISSGLNPPVTDSSISSTSGSTSEGREGLDPSITTVTPIYSKAMRAGRLTNRRMRRSRLRPTQANRRMPNASINTALPPVDEHHKGKETLEDDLTDRTSSDSQLEELSDEEFPSFFTERVGMLFHSCRNSPYPLPVNANELARLNLMHDALYRLLGAHYLGPVPKVLAPTPDNRKRKVLDICTGNGKWAMDMAEAFPEVKFRGVDIVPISTRYPLPNVRFEMHDVGEQFRWSDGTFDLIHGRDISMAIRNWPNLINECARLLHPGGLFVSCEWIHFPVTDPSTDLDVNTYAPASVRFFNTIHQILQEKGVQLGLSNPYLSLARSPHFTDITTERRNAPIGQWHEDETMKSIGNNQKTIFQRFTTSVMPMLTDSGMTQLEAEQLTTDYLEEVNSKDGLVCQYVITHARKV